LPNPKYYGKKPFPAISYIRQRKILAKMASYNLALPNDLFKKDKGVTISRPPEPALEVMGVKEEPAVVTGWQEPPIPVTGTGTSFDTATPMVSTDFFLDD
jgi:hypothetical protein